VTGNTSGIKEGNIENNIGRIWIMLMLVERCVPDPCFKNGKAGGLSEEPRGQGRAGPRGRRGDRGVRWDGPGGGGETIIRGERKGDMAHGTWATGNKLGI